MIICGAQMRYYILYGGGCLIHKLRGPANNELARFAPERPPSLDPGVATWPCSPLPYSGVTQKSSLSLAIYCTILPVHLQTVVLPLHICCRALYLVIVWISQRSLKGSRRSTTAVSETSCLNVESPANR